MNRNSWSHQFLDGIEAVHDDHNAWALVSWIQAEGGNAWWNPLNCTEVTYDSQGHRTSWDYNSIHVQNYPTFEAGLWATVKTIKSTNPNYHYAPILDSLRRGLSAKRTLSAVGASAWGTVGTLALKVLPEVKADYWHFASYGIAPS